MLSTGTSYMCSHDRISRGLEPTHSGNERFTSSSTVSDTGIIGRRDILAWPTDVARGKKEQSHD